jgi:hypothetical protein
MAEDARLRHRIETFDEVQVTVAKTGKAVRSNTSCACGFATSRVSMVIGSLTSCNTAARIGCLLGGYLGCRGYARLLAWSMNARRLATSPPRLALARESTAVIKVKQTSPSKRMSDILGMDALQDGAEARPPCRSPGAEQAMAQVQGRGTALAVPT